MDMLYAVGLRAVLLFVCFALPYWCTCGTWWLYRTLCRPLTPEEAEAWVRGCRASAFNTFFVVPLLCVFLASITKEATAARTGGPEPDGAQALHAVLCKVLLCEEPEEIRQAAGTTTSRVL